MYHTHKSVNVISWINSLQCFKNNNIKKFYAHCILYLSTLTDSAEFIEVLQRIFVLLLSSCENDNCLKYRTKFY